MKPSPADSARFTASAHGGGDCADCDASRLNAKRAGHRDWREGVCGECAWTTWEPGPEVTEAMVQQAMKEMALPYIAPASADQPDLFGERAA